MRKAGRIRAKLFPELLVEVLVKTETIKQATKKVKERKEKKIYKTKQSTMDGHTVLIPSKLK